MSKLTAGLLIIILSGCSIHYTDSQGKDNYFGFVLISIEASHCIITNTATSIGLTVDTTKESGGVNVGIRTISKYYINENRIVEIEESDSKHTLPKGVTSYCSGRIKNATQKETRDRFIF